MAHPGHQRGERLWPPGLRHGTLCGCVAWKYTSLSGGLGEECMDFPTDFPLVNR